MHRNSPGYDESLAAAYMRGDTRLELHAFVYREVSQDSELVNQLNLLFDPEMWRLSTRSRDDVELRSGRDVAVESATLYDRGNGCVSTAITLSAGDPRRAGFWAKFLEIYDMVLGRSGSSAFVAIATPVQLGQETAAEEMLRQFVVDHHDRLRRCLSAADSTQTDCRLPTSDEQTP